MDRSILSRPGPAPDRVLRYGPHPDHVADVWLPGTEERPLVFLLHGGFWRPRFDRTHTRLMAAALRDEGWTVASVEYRREQGNPDACTGDVRLALEVVPGEVGAPGAGIVLVGHSAGGQLALWAGVACPPPGLRGIVALAPVADLVHAYDANLGNGAVAEFLGGPPGTRPDLDPVRLPAPAGKVILVHGADDTGVPPAVSESYVDAHAAAKLMLLPDVAHFELIDPGSAAWTGVVAAVAQAGR
ncbi:alpha/beta hydrolase [Amycolatopsis acidiphila]|nr:alpha/beta hydrolase [Amycolatopsis acidiphila]UIJ57998.1 alpha/beta hydrolase [Amycolatopsis acidiphila]GHG70632.1 lipase [Amycolatopsis acidiphila]